MVSCHFADCVINERIIISRASNHWTGSFDALTNAIKSNNNPHISLPTGEVSNISHFGKVKLMNEMELKNVLYVPTFKHNLLSSQQISYRYWL